MHKQKYLTIKGGKIYSSIKTYRKSRESRKSRKSRECKFIRVLKGKTKGDFKFLASSNRNIVFIKKTKIDNLLIKDKLDTYKLLLSIGYPDNYIKELVKDNIKFKLGILGDCKITNEIKLATWENVFKMYNKKYRNFKKMDLSLSTIKKIKIDKKNIDFEFYKNIKSFNDFYNKIIKYNQYLKTKYFRYYLFVKENFNELFKGDGYIYDKNNKKLDNEYIIFNRSIDFTKKKYDLINLQIF